METITPNKDMLKTLDEVLAHNRKILEMNLLIIKCFVDPPVMIPIDESSNLKGRE